MIAVSWTIGNHRAGENAPCYPVAVPDPSAIAARIRAWDERGPHGPMTLELYPTLRCNLDCAFCDTTDRHRPAVNELSSERMLGLIDEAAAMGVRRVFVLGGGEPLVARQTPALMHRIKALGLEGILTTNGTIFPPELTRQVLDDGWDEIHFSVDGPSPEVHDRLRGARGAFRRTVTNICHLNVNKRRRGLDRPRIALHFVITNQNHTTLSDMVRLGAALGVFRIDFDALIAYRPEQAALLLDPTQARALTGEAARALALAESLGITTTLASFLQPESLERGQRPPPLPEDPAPRPGDGPLTGALRGAPCLKAWHYVVVQADGRTSPCCVLAGMGGSVAEAPLDDVWRADPFMDSVRAGMASGRPLPRCQECSPNILRHEAAIRQEL